VSLVSSFSFPLSFDDLISVKDPHASTYPAAVKWIMYPRWWLESIGYWGAPFTATPGRAPAPVHPNGYPTLPSKEAYAAAYPDGLEGATYTNYCFQTPPTASFTFQSFISYFSLFIVGVVCTLLVQKLFPGGDSRKAYEPIPDSRI
jgi:hypothetical protein